MSSPKYSAGKTCAVTRAHAAWQALSSVGTGQRTHAVHHLNTNHMTEGETHVPMVVGSAEANDVLAARRRLGKRRFAVTNLVGHLLFGCKFSLLRYLLQMYRLTSTTFLSTPSTPH